MTCPVRLYTNGKYAHAQSGGLDLTSSKLRSCNMCLELQISIAIGIIQVYEIIGTNWSLKHEVILELTDL